MFLRQCIMEVFGVGVFMRQCIRVVGWGVSASVHHGGIWGRGVYASVQQLSPT